MARAARQGAGSRTLHTGKGDILCRGYFAGGSFMGGGGVRHPWNPQRSQGPHARFKCRAVLPSEADRFAKRTAAERSIRSQHLSESAVPNTSPKTMDPQKCSAIGISIALPTALNFARGAFRPLPYGRKFPTKPSPPEILPPAEYIPVLPKYIPVDYIPVLPEYIAVVREYIPVLPSYPCHTPSPVPRPELKSNVESLQRRVFGLLESEIVVKEQLDSAQHAKAVLDHDLAGLRAQLVRVQAEAEAEVQALEAQGCALQGEYDDLHDKFHTLQTQKMEQFREHQQTVQELQARLLERQFEGERMQLALDQVLWCGVVWCGVVWCGVVWCGVVWCGVVWCGVVWCGVVRCGVVHCGAVPCRAVLCRAVLCCAVLCGAERCGAERSGVERCSVWGGVGWGWGWGWRGAARCAVVCFGVPKALLPNGNGRDGLAYG